jgi:hypothetical protein
MTTWHVILHLKPITASSSHTDPSPTDAAAPLPSLLLICMPSFHPATSQQLVVCMHGARPDVAVSMAPSVPWQRAAHLGEDPWCGGRGRGSMESHPAQQARRTRNSRYGSIRDATDVWSSSLAWPPCPPRAECIDTTIKKMIQQGGVQTLTEVGTKSNRLVPFQLRRLPIL